MAKIYGLFGSLTGKIADVVMVVRNGEQIARKYQPLVSNPSTPAQVASRAKLKALSQLSAVMADSIALQRTGLVSPRNKFVKLNYGATSYANNQAEINLSAVKLTHSVVSLPDIVAERGTGGINVRLSNSAEGISRVVYVMYRREENNLIRFAGSTVVESDGTNGNFPGQLPSSAVEAYIYAYGVRDNTEAARAVFGDLHLLTAQAVAAVITTSALTSADITLTETKYNNLAAQA